MLGSATFTTVLSSMIMNSAKHMAASVHHLRLPSLRRIRSGISGGVLSGDAERRDLLARDDGGEGVREVPSLLGGQRLYEVGDAGDTQLDQAAGFLAGLVGRAYRLVAPVLRVLGTRDEAALDHAVDGAAHSRHREAHLVGDRLERGALHRAREQLQDADLADAQLELADRAVEVAPAGLEDELRETADGADELLVGGGSGRGFVSARGFGSARGTGSAGARITRLRNSCMHARNY